ncbi:putative non-ribosomal peptide synthase-like protein [Hyaloscypha variabilis F]|uniref:Putative non-ribosomal peptide synthase-like protein n=1 Tax=Hyaloscypha variabilis (strain UAMH 11265 / GT02V1 / F) TaxID=1149755 RepID=A0A2J6RX39_HYAVF|nr:putative non-ribosomal peptide synthase-like protein [Hyaloscypha variabilis F]
MERGPVVLSYNTLSRTADERALHLHSHFNIEENNIILLHMHDHYLSILYFWAIIAAGGIPCMSTQVSKDGVQREKRLASILKLLHNPLVITTDDLKTDFADLDNVRLVTLTELEATPTSRLDNKGARLGGYQKCHDDVAVLMLTSGSTGDPKAVALTHNQILHAVVGKSMLHHTTEDDVFMSWTGLDHVANLTEVHLHAMSLGANQIHLPASMVLEEPMIFLEKASKHKVSYAFAPNFFLASLASTRSTKYNSEERGQLPKKAVVDLSNLRALISGGESNVVQTCNTLTSLLQHLGAPECFIRPGFGMTETCAGSIYNAIDCPAYDIGRNAEFACLGDCIPGIEFRICRQDGSVAPDDEVGDMQVRGEVVFKCYYNDKCSTVKSFTEDGWFKTGDRGFKDLKGRLHLTGRDKDSVIIHGVNHHPQAIETAIELAKIPGVTPSFVVAFAHRPAKSETESVVVAYLPSYNIPEPIPRVEAAASICKSVVTHCGVRPYKILPLDERFLQKSSLGKLSRSTIRKAFEDGVYDNLMKLDEALVACYKDDDFEPAANRTEFAIVEACNSLLNTTGAEIGINNDLFKLGISSIDLLKLRLHLQCNLNISEIPITVFFSNPVIRDLAKALEDIQKHTYEPVVVLQASGDKTPLFLLHPGTGEVLIFMNLARHFPDRPIYALRARGFDNEPFFTSLSELVTTYHAAIKKIQPHGPYAFLGYSFGSFAAFELTKLLEASGDEVKLLATLDQAPYQKERARAYDWTEVCMTISFFLSLITEDFAYKAIPAFRLLSHSQVLDTIFNIAPSHRIQELGLTKEKLDNWANLALSLKKCVWDWEPSGVVSKMDVFYTGPLVGRVPAKTTEEWFDGFISKWEPFVREGEGNVTWTEVGGTHRTMIQPPHLGGFMRVFRKVLEARGL